MLLGPFFKPLNVGILSIATKEKNHYKHRAESLFYSKSKEVSFLPVKL